MNDYTEWRKLEGEFRDLHARHPDLDASWESFNRNWERFGDLDCDEDRYQNLCGIAAALAGRQPPQDPTAGWLDSVKTFLVNSSSSNLDIWPYARDQKSGQPGVVGVTCSEPFVEDGKIYTIRSLCRVFADCCLEHARKSLTPPPKNVKIASPAVLAKRRETALQAFVRNHKTTIAAVSRAAGVDKKNLLQWRHGKLADGSVMSRRIEDVLSGKTALIFGGARPTRKGVEPGEAKLPPHSS